jgi:hypothetical protein
MNGRTLLMVALVSTSLAGCAAGGKGGPAAPQADFSSLSLAPTATTGVIRGIVVDDAIRPLADATVMVSPGNQTTHSTPQGTFGFSGLAPGTYFVRVSKTGYNSTQSSTDVVAGIAEPPILKVLLARNLSTSPYVEVLRYDGFMQAGVSIGITSVGTTTFQGTIGNDTTIWNSKFTQLPMWAQGELVWEQNQPGGGMMIWEMVVGGTNDHKGYRETAVSPALAYWNTSVIQEEAANVTSSGIDYRFFGGPHPLLAPGGGVIPPASQCPTVDTVVEGKRNPCTFGYGLTTEQRATAYIHQFYNFAPPEGWRFTKDGDPVVPQ